MTIGIIHSAMKKQDFAFDLPPHLIAQMPLERRDDSRLLHLKRQSREISHRHFSDILDHLRPHDCLVINNTKVIPARLSVRKESGGMGEVFLERQIAPDSVIARIRLSKPPKINQKLFVTDQHYLRVKARQGEFWKLQAEQIDDILELFVKHGAVPLPPYIQREVDNDDKQRYQTVYAEKFGAVAAPTAGLHFTEELLAKCRAKGVNLATITLHVAAGTYQPVRVADIKEHQMHREIYEINQTACDVINQSRAQGGRIIAVGTTSVRTLETVGARPLVPQQGETDIFIYPGYQFQWVDALITNFHLPESTLMMLVSAFAGREFILQAYRLAVQQEYRFFSYGDAMFIE